MTGVPIVARRCALLAGVLLAVGAAEADSSDSGAGAPLAPAVSHRASASSTSAPLYWGAWIGAQLTGTEAPWDYRAVTRFEQMVGKGVSLVSFSSPFANCTGQPCTPYSFPSAPFSRIRANGAIPFFSWSSASLPVSATEPAYSLRAVSEGRFDGYIDSWATAARDWGHPFFLRFDWEMNASTFPWSATASGNGPAEYVAAWRHVHQIFTRVGARNATWVWCPNADPDQDPELLAAMYPGDAYVDWTCLDGYNSDDPWRTFAGIVEDDYAVISEQIAPGKPMIIGETASTEVGGSKAEWISQMFGSLRRLPDIRGLIWFDRTTGGADWPAESSPSSLAAFSRGVRAGSFVGSRYAGLGGSPIAPPRGGRR